MKRRKKRIAAHEITNSMMRLKSSTWQIPFQVHFWVYKLFQNTCEETKLIKSDFENSHRSSLLNKIFENLKH